MTKQEKLNKLAAQVKMLEGYVDDAVEISEDPRKAFRSEDDYNEFKDSIYAFMFGYMKAELAFIQDHIKEISKTLE